MAESALVGFEGPRYIFKIDRDTRFTKADGLRVRFSDCLCYNQTGENNQVVRCESVTVEFRSSSAAGYFLNSLKAMQRELLISYLQHPLLGEQVDLQRSVGDRMIRDFYLADCQLTVILNPDTSRYRLILLSGCHSLSVCVELPEDFYETMADNHGNVQDAYMAWFVRVHEGGAIVTRQMASIKQFIHSQEDNVSLGGATSVAEAAYSDASDLLEG